MEAKLLMASSPATLSAPHVSNSRPNYLLPLKAMQSKSFACLNSSLPKKPNLSVQAASVRPSHSLCESSAHSDRIEESLATKKRVDETDSLTLEGIRHSLIRQEDSIIFSLLERAQYCHNLPTYDPKAFPVDGFHGSLVEHILKETEKLHGQVGRFSSPDEHPFFPNDVPEPGLPPLHYPQQGHMQAWRGDGLPDPPCSCFQFLHHLKNICNALENSENIRLLPLSCKAARDKL
ncbi:hypothetical protein ACFX13_045963 [Malus domestica]